MARYPFGADTVYVLSQLWLLSDGSEARGSGVLLARPGGQMTNIRFEKSSDRSNIVLDGRVDIRNAGELQKTLCEAVALPTPIVVDCTATEWLDTACLQLLLAAHRAAPGRVSVKLASDSSVKYWLEQSGFAKELTLA